MNIINSTTFPCINDPDFAQYAQRYIEIEQKTLHAIAQYGLPFESSSENSDNALALKHQLRARVPGFPTMTKAFTSTGFLMHALPAAREKEVTRHSFR